MYHDNIEFSSNDNGCYLKSYTNFSILNIVSIFFLVSEKRIVRQDYLFVRISMCAKSLG